MASGEKGAGEKNVRVVQAAAGARDTAGEKSPRLGIGLDIGSTATKLVVLGADGATAHTGLMPTGFSSVDAAARALASLEAAGLVPGEGARVVATGYGRVAVPYADKVVTEITCHGRGAARLFGPEGTVIDVGGQDTKVIRLHAGRVAKFAMNDKCAAGTGRFLQVLSGILGMELAELGEAAGRGKPAAISSMCAVFAETEIIGLLARGTPPADIAAGVFRSIARRMRGLAARIPLRGECTFTGGLATSPSFSRLLSEELGVPVNVPEYPQLVGAIGAALIAARI